MRTSTTTAAAALSAASALIASLCFSREARADYVSTVNTPPPKAPAEAPVARTAEHHEGLVAAGSLCTCFSGTYAFGLEARVGYTFPVNVYVGGNAQYYFGNSVNNSNAYAFFVGPEIGYKLYPIDQLEIRPFAFVGAGFNKQVNSNPFSTNTHNTIAVQPGLIGLYHFGDMFFVGGDAHFMVTPSPVAFALLATAGAGF